MANDEWRTPDWLFNRLNKEFNFTLDAAATEKNAKCTKYYTKKEDGLAQSWQSERVFVNPPYSRGSLIKWTKKAYQESRGGCLAVMLIPSRTSTEYWHRYAMQAYEIRFIDQRVKFIDPETGQEAGSPPTPTSIVIFQHDETSKETPYISSFKVAT